ncbi:hypothetical protein EIP91_002874 [Steccherinum ochraceum]|uniref:Uncharacterized protein n=1 Tax=Steccherinum ochraceum TaxID=92696 RepID=A0A4R0S0K2_9APHY|nr:hypothetical protein EIP91_002874 [Steccherinum ochraceum]
MPSQPSSSPPQATVSHLAPPNSRLQGRQTRFGTLSSSYSTPDLCLSPSGSTLAQSTSVPSLTSTVTTSDLASSSYSSIPVSNSSCSAGSIRSARSTDRLHHGFRQFEDRTSGGATNGFLWLSSGYSPILPAPTPFSYVSRRRKRPLAVFLNTGTRYMRSSVKHLPSSLWDRLVFVVFCVYVAILFRALFGFGVTPSSTLDYPHLPVPPSAASGNVSSDATFVDLPNGPHQYPDDSESKVVAPASAFRPSKQVSSVPQPERGVDEPAIKKCVMRKQRMGVKREDGGGEGSDEGNEEDCEE